MLKLTVWHTGTSANAMWEDLAIEPAVRLSEATDPLPCVT